MADVTTPLLGVNIEEAVVTAPDMPLGSVVKAKDGSEYMLVQMITTAADQFDALIISEANTAIVYSNANSGSAFGDRVGITQVAIPLLSHAWVLVQGVGSVNVLASAAANVVLNGTATDGTLDDDQTAGSEDADGIVLTTARGAGTGDAPCVMKHTTVGETNS